MPVPLVYDLDPANIACEPRDRRLGRRDFGRMLVVDRLTQRLVDSSVQQFASWFRSGDVLVLNDSKRLPGVLFARTALEGAQVECRIVSLEGETGLICRIFPMHNIRPDCALLFPETVTAFVSDMNIGPHHLCRLRIPGTNIRELLIEHGKPITSFFYKDYWNIDDYNPYYSTNAGSVESPMAGLHFTPELLDHICASGITVCFLTLHVKGSWLPPLETAVSKMMEEPYDIPVQTSSAISEAKRRGNHVIACGSTVVRALESAVAHDGSIRAGVGSSNLYLQPGSPIRIVDHYFTNFHPSGSSLMQLDAAFCEPSSLLKAYRHARSAGYMFFEFGDSILYL